MKSWLLAVAILALAGGDSLAQKSQKPTAQKHLDTARRHFELQEFDAAERELKEAYRIDSKPEILYAIAQAQRKNGDCEHAITSYRNFLRSDPPRAQAKLAEDNVVSCQAELDRRAAEPPPVNPPPVIAPPAQPPPIVVAPSGVPWTSNWAGHGLVIGGLIATAGGLWVVRDGQQKISSINDAIYYDDFVDRSQSAASAKTERTLGTVFAGAGVVLIATGIITYIVRAPGDEPRVSVSITARSASVAWAW
jgi:tetratricopeptide (TPR) repeat protein